MSSKTVKMPGLRILRPLIFGLGFLDGRFHRASIDAGSGLLNSSYVHSRLFQYQEFCRKRMVHLERELSAIRTEASIKLEELSEMKGEETAPVPDEDILNIPPLSPDDSGFVMTDSQKRREISRLAKKAAECKRQSLKKQSEMNAKKKELICRLIEIQNRIRLREGIVDQELGATADALKSELCTYCHGVILKPVYREYIPEIDHKEYLDDYRGKYCEDNRRIAEVLEKEVR